MYIYLKKVDLFLIKIKFFAPLNSLVSISHLMNTLLYKITNVYPTNVSGKWSYELLGCLIDAPDDFVISKYILHRLSERHNVIISWDVNPSLGLPHSKTQIRFIYAIDTNNFKQRFLKRILSQLNCIFSSKGTTISIIR